MGINGLLHVNTFVEYENNRLLLPMVLELWWGPLKCQAKSLMQVISSYSQQQAAEAGTINYIPKALPRKLYIGAIAGKLVLQ